MPENKTLAYTAVTLAGALAGIIAYQRTGLLSAVFTVFAVTWILYWFTDYEKIWNFLGNFLNPTLTAFLGLLIGTTYFIMDGHLIDISIQFGLGMALIGAALGILVAKYWSIAD